MTMFYRTSSANTYDTAIRNITMRQSALSGLQENLTSGKRVLRPSDDPTSAALAERALTRINRIATDQRALEAQRSSIEVAESTLGSVTDAMQRFRELVVSAGNGVHSSTERKRHRSGTAGPAGPHVFALANTQDTNGQPLFSALGSALAPFVGPQAGATRTTPSTVCRVNRAALRWQFRSPSMATVRSCCNPNAMVLTMSKTATPTARCSQAACP
jgi:flagellar hook-associated protein 3 FlgL